MGEWRTWRYRLMPLVVAACVLLVAQSGRAHEEILTNELVVKMVKAGLPESVIVAKIQSSASEFDTRTDTLLTLKQAGVSGRVLEAMIRARRPAIVQEKPTSQPATSVARERKRVERTPVAALGDELQRLNDLKVQGKITEKQHALLRKHVIETFAVSPGRVAKRRDRNAGTIKEANLAKLVGRWKGSWKDSRGWHGDISVNISLRKGGGITDVVMAGEIEGTYWNLMGGVAGGARFDLRDTFSRRGKLNEKGVLVLVGEVARGVQGEIAPGTSKELYRFHREKGELILKGDFTITRGADEGVTGTRLLRKAGGG